MLWRFGGWRKALAFHFTGFGNSCEFLQNSRVNVVLDIIAEMRFRDTASFGKRQEYAVIAELLKRGFDVYMTLVDDQGIDCVIRLKGGKRYLDIQIKARSKDARHWNLFAGMPLKPRSNYFFIFYTEMNQTFWIMPSKDVYRLGSKNVSGKNIGKTSLSLPKSEKSKKAEAFNKYKNNFELLRHFDK